MSKIKYYDGGYKDIIMSIPTNTVEITIKLKTYENGELVDMEQAFDLESIRYAEDLFEQCCAGEYPTYTFTEKGEELVERWKKMAKGDSV